ncbi:hypothetical protein [Bradyrhizobium yuanmingense]|uniref:hypothetical protein n=1 Tax=Bradyrhizobium yuanmingense TaxID=108015 RepID=UPI0023B8C469|nr:hypothetical protein [Bradyrhizobium yuanmingense]MDF0495370.1 hypothetical protein [Bradyrhizobium yuanmingense]
MALFVRIKQPRPDLSPAQICLRFTGYAQDYADAARELHEFKFVSVRYYLLGHAFELILKSYILSQGEPEKKIRKLNHSLIKAHDDARALGYAPSDKRLRQIVEWLDPFHENQDFRYAGSSGHVILPKIEDALGIFKSTYADILPLAKAFYALQMKGGAGSPPSG